MSKGHSVKPTIKDVAIEAEVSLGTASRVINNYDDVNPVLRARVHQAIEKLGYTPDAVAQSMRFRSTRTVGILIRDFSSSAFSDFARATQSSLFAKGYVPLLAGYEDEPQRELDIMRAFAQRRIDGLIVSTSSDGDHEVTQARKALGVPMILFDRDPDNQQDTIAIDHRGGIRLAMRHLHRLGHKRIALITGQKEVRPARDRLIAFQNSYAELGLTFDPSLARSGSFSAEFAELQTADLLCTDPPPTAIIIGGVNMLPGVLKAIRCLGLRIPQDVSIISATNAEIAQLVTPPVTELHVDYANIGREAAALIMGRLDQSMNPGPRVLQFETTLIERDSCGPATISTPRRGSRST